MTLQEQIEALACSNGQSYSEADLTVFNEFKSDLNRGVIRAAERDPAGKWRTNAWVKRGILLGFRMGVIRNDSTGSQLQFLDKNTYPIQTFTPEDRVRIVPGGSSIRDGAYIAPGVVCMPPMFVNAGAYVDEGTMIDSHALVGSAAEITGSVRQPRVPASQVSLGTTNLRILGREIALPANPEPNTEVALSDIPGLVSGTVILNEEATFGDGVTSKIVAVAPLRFAAASTSRRPRRAGGCRGERGRQLCLRRLRARWRDADRRAANGDAHHASDDSNDSDNTNNSDDSDHAGDTDDPRRHRRLQQLRRRRQRRRRRRLRRHRQLRPRTADTIVSNAARRCGIIVGAAEVSHGAINLGPDITSGPRRKRHLPRLTASTSTSVSAAPWPCETRDARAASNNSASSLSSRGCGWPTRALRRAALGEQEQP